MNTRYSVFAVKEKKEFLLSASLRTIDLIFLFPKPARERISHELKLNENSYFHCDRRNPFSSIATHFIIEKDK